VKFLIIAILNLEFTAFDPAGFLDEWVKAINEHGGFGNRNARYPVFG
jgi:hypothetical protein